MAEYRHGEMEIGYQRQLFAGFLRFTTWVCVLIILVLLLMAVFLT